MKAVLLVCIGIVLVGCSDNTPVKLETGVLPPVLYDNKPIKLNPLVLNKKCEPVEGVQVTYQTSPSGIAEISNNGELLCRSSGDATILFNGGGQSILANIKCRLVTKIEVPSQLSMTIGKAYQDPKPQVLNEKGEAILDVLVGLKSANEGIVQVKNGHLFPVEMGKTQVAYSAGQITTSMEVVVSKVISEVSGALALVDGGIKVIPLAKGSYEIEIQVSPASGGAGNGVSITTTGASCNQPERSQHHFQCEVSDMATLAISNPSAFGMGAAMSGFINVTQWPDN
ncbi:MAG: hypothetical protein PHH11_18000 [Methylomonas sp.]|nr:hypothetical protein [Methylomonas sp.]